MRIAEPRFVATLLVAALAAAAAAPGEVLNRIVLRVDGEIATLADWESARNERIEQISRAQDLPLAERRRLVAEAGRATMKELFDELLVLSRAKQLGVEPSPAKLEQMMENAKRRFGFSTDQELEQALAQSGLTMEEFRSRMTRNLLASETIDREVERAIEISEDEVARYWREHPDEFERPEARRVEEIVVRDDVGLDAAGQAALATELARGVAAGASFADAAAAAGAAERVAGPIDHGWVEPGALAAELEAAAFAVKVAGGVTSPVAGRGGLHVMRVAEIRPAAPRPFDEVSEAIRVKLYNERYTKELREYLEQRASIAYIVEDLPPEAVGYRTAATGAVDPLRQLLQGVPGADAAAPGAETAAPAPGAETAAPAPDAEPTPPGREPTPAPEEPAPDATPTTPSEPAPAQQVPPATTPEPPPPAAA